MGIRLDPRATIHGMAARPMAEILAWVSAHRPGEHPVHDTRIVQGRGGESLSPPQLEALLAAGMVAEESGVTWLTPKGAGLRAATFTPLFPRTEAETAMKTLAARLTDLDIDGMKARDAWLFGSFMRGAERVGDLDITINLRTCETWDDEGLNGHRGFPSISDHRAQRYIAALVKGLPETLVSGINGGHGIGRPGMACRMILKGGQTCREDLPHDPEIFATMKLPTIADFEVDDPAHKISAATYEIPEEPTPCEPC